MFRKTLLVFSAVILFFGCGPVVLIPPEIDLIPFERVGLISFSLENAQGRIDEIATQRFLQDIIFHQRGAQIIELGTVEDVLAQIDKNVIDQEAASAIGDQFDVTAFFFWEDFCFRCQTPNRHRRADQKHESPGGFQHVCYS